MTIFPELAEVEKAIREALDPVPKSLKEILCYLLEKRGKMLRPRLLITCASLAGGEEVRRSKFLFRAAAAVEMIHTASLVHDDIIDEASRRRGQSTLHLRWGRSRATLAGDLLLARAFALLSSPGSEKGLLYLLARSVALLCRGELCQMNRRYCWELTERQYYRIIYLKTAQFIASCCEAGGWIAGASPGQRRALRDYGRNLGQAFQIADDLHDYAGYPQQLGKPVGNDLEQGLATLPLIHLFETRKQYLKMVRMAPPNLALPLDLQRTLREAVNINGSLDYARAAALRMQEKAVQALQLFPAAPERQMLAGMAAAVTGRLCGRFGYRPVDSEVKLS